MKWKGFYYPTRHTVQKIFSQTKKFILSSRKFGIGIIYSFLRFFYPKLQLFPNVSCWKGSFYHVIRFRYSSPYACTLMYWLRVWSATHFWGEVCINKFIFFPVFSHHLTSNIAIRYIRKLFYSTFLPQHWLVFPLLSKQFSPNLSVLSCFQLIQLDEFTS